ncbi:MAG TPA: signal recognition particle-docking protein FtsY, partial [Ottowia beijingensis]|nr:signal recognition particle-docking protein FtsY [Ottowia beijingensis]
MFSFFRRKKAEPTPDQAPATAEAPADTPPLDAPALPLDDLERQALAAAPADETAGAAAGEPAPPPATNGGFMSRWFGGGAAPVPAPVAETEPHAPAPEPAPPVADPVPPPVQPSAPSPAPAAIETAAVPADLVATIAEKDLELVPTTATAQAARVGWMDRLKTGLKRTGSSITTVFTGTQIDEALYEDLETALLMADA